MRIPILAVAALSLAACVPGPSAPITAPAPVAAEAVAAGHSDPGATQQGQAAAAVVVQPAVAGIAAPASPRQADPGPSAGGDAGPSWDIVVAPYERNDRVEHYVARYTGPARGWVAERLARGSRYESMIRAKLRAGGLPEDMYYLAFVESGFDARARSRAAAVGMWQFMAATAKWMELRVDWWVDERRDPVRSTDAAVRFLAALNDQFGSVYLAAAAYNGGPGRVSRGLARFAGELEGAEGEDRFFALSGQDYLPRETSEYVPQLIAAALIGNDPARYEMDFVRREPFAYDSVRVPALTSLPAVARAAGTTVDVVRDLNPQFIRAITPPRTATFVRIPVGSAARFDAAFARLDDSTRTGVRREVLPKAMSLAAAARSLGTTTRGITAFNPNLKRKGGKLAAGQTLLVAPRDVAAAAEDIPDPSSSRSSKAARYHTVKRGETLGHLAERYDTSVEALMRLNNLKKPLIRIGQELAID